MRSREPDYKGLCSLMDNHFVTHQAVLMRPAVTRNMALAGASAVQLVVTRWLTGKGVSGHNIRIFLRLLIG